MEYVVPDGDGAHLIHAKGLVREPVEGIVLDVQVAGFGRIRAGDAVGVYRDGLTGIAVVEVVVPNVVPAFHRDIGTDEDDGAVPVRSSLLDIFEMVTVDLDFRSHAAA
ncbi:hypothetical protein [Nocardia seriolae]|uniref:hypothetical protein n=1 Tax=Nocardia seriolae TaxID=37332 RepID=UPI001160C129|nr:hypothetical protein [Nocardia seriolae]QOW33102.1 hypothetical protein IMZ23_35470 [Nocardia seriolae]QUN14660.1 hypothetical protein KEC46_19375 [Nocardia seriolae]WNJ60708.1 hypothetical protein RMO66_08305 [Nocardia seriolae]